MIISNSRKFVFVHIPKTAGTSLTSVLAGFSSWNDLVLGGTELGEALDPHFSKAFGISKHSPAQEIQRVVGTSMWEEYFSFAFVRHPYTRLVSFYKWQRRALAKAPPDARIRSWPATQAHLRTRNFSEFLRDEQFLRSRAGKPQADWVCDGTGKRIVDFVGRFEELEAGLRVIAEHIGIPIENPPLLNSAMEDSEEPDLVLSESDYDVLHHTYRVDFEMFEYDPSLRPGRDAKGPRCD